MSDIVLSCQGLVKRFGGITATNNVTLNLRRGARHALIGPNGAGKTTLINLLTGVLEPTEGSITLEGQDITRLPAHQRVRAGLGWVPQEREVFPSLTVEENLGVVARPGAWNLDRVYGLFPRLRERRANYGNQLGLIVEQ